MPDDDTPKGELKWIGGGPFDRPNREYERLVVVDEDGCEIFRLELPTTMELHHISPDKVAVSVSWVQGKDFGVETIDGTAEEITDNDLPPGRGSLDEGSQHHE